MVRRAERDPTQASSLEILGAWLHVWTPPRDVVIPPVPWGKVAAACGGVLLVAALVAIFVAPAIDDAKDRSAAKERRELAQRAAARRRAQELEQRPRFGTANGDRAAVLATIEAAIGADARRRFDPDARVASCEPAQGVDAAAVRVAYDCTSAVRDIVGAGRQEGARGVLAIPFRAVVDFGRGRYAFCKVNPAPGEQVIPDPAKLVELPEACRIPKA